MDGGVVVKSTSNGVGTIIDIDATGNPTTDPLTGSGLSYVYGNGGVLTLLNGWTMMDTSHVLAQDEATSVVWGMPGFVANAGLADKVLPLGELAPEICRRIRIGREAALEKVPH